MRIGVKFCGNCNPHLKTGNLLRELEQAEKEAEFVRWDDPGSYDVLLILNGCQVGCAAKPDFGGPSVVVTSESVQRWPVTGAELRDAVLHALKEAVRSGFRRVCRED